jgi:hypothetical protein
MHKWNDVKPVVVMARPERIGGMRQLSGSFQRGYSMVKFIKFGAVSMLALVAGSSAVFAADNVSGDVGVNYNSHFVSYGVDVWGAGSSIYGGQSTASIYGDLAVKATPDLSWNLNVWSDINDNVPSGIGGHLQEVDINTGFGYNFGSGVSGSVTFGAWSYAGDVEEVLDLGLGFDDTGLIIPDFAFNPHITWHNRISGNGSQKIGSAVALSVGPSFPLGSSGFSLTIPAGVTFFTTKDFQGGSESGYGYSYFGGSLATPLSFIPASYGAWSTNFDLIAYFTDKKAIPSNPVENFLTASINLKVGF